MSTTLTNGLKLPDKGSVDWYADMQNNYAILDGAVGTIAEHSTQIAGKAPLVHTHTKSDVTDLFNSANTWTGDNTYTQYIYMKNSSIAIGNTPSSNTSKEITFTDKNNATLSKIFGTVRSNGKSYIALRATNKFTNGSLDPNGSSVNSDFYVGIESDGTPYNKHAAHTLPDTNNTYDLGSSSYQWNNLYAKNYYYNGVAWGLDKDNTWTGANSFYKSIQIHGGRNAYIMPEFGASYSGLAFGTLEFKQSFKFGDWVDDNSTIRINTSNAYVEIYAGLDSANSVNKARLNPVNTTVAELGTSTNKWKTLNGVNPGALSLPSGDSVNIDTTNWNFSWDANHATAPFDGYISISCFGSALQINNETKAYAMTFAPGSDGFICGLLPVSTGDSIKVLLTKTQTSQYEGYKFIKSRGNVS